MKHLFFIAVFTIFACVAMQAQSCLPNGITFNTQEQIDGFPFHYPGCKAIEGGVYLYGPGIVNVDSLWGLTAINGDFHVDLAANLTNLSGLGNVTSIDALQIYESGLTDLTGLGNLASLRSLRIGFASSVSPSLVSLQGMPHVTSVSDVIIKAPALTNLKGLENVKHIDILDINDNAELTSLQGLEGLDSIAYHLLIRWNPKLNSLNGLQNLKIIGGDLGIWQNPSLVSMDSLKNLVSIGALHEGEGMNIFNNGLLPFCSIESVCAYIQQMPGASFISGNAPGCASVSEVDSLCANNSSASHEIWGQHALNLFPNPNEGVFSVELPETLPSGAALMVTDFAGRIVFRQNIEAGTEQQSVNAADLASGFYFLQLVASGQVLAVEKFVKQ